MNYQTKIQNVLQLYKPYFHITSLCEGLQYALKCKEDKTVGEYKPRKITMYQDTPQVLCLACSGGDKLKKFSVIKKAASKDFSVISTKSDYFQKDGCVTIACKKANHMIDTKEVVKYCQLCSDQESQVYITKRVSKKHIINTFCFQKNVFVLTVKSLSQLNVIEALKELLSSSALLQEKRNIIIEKKSFKRFNIIKVLHDCDVKFTENEQDIYVIKHDSEPEHGIMKEPEISLEEPEHGIMEEPEDDISLEDFLQQCTEDIERLEKEPVSYTDISEIPVKNSIEHCNNNIKRNEIDSILNKPQDYNNDINVEMTYEKFLSVFDEHNNFMNEYYKNLQKCSPVFNEEESKEDYVIFKKTCDEKYYEFDPVINNKVCYLQNNSCHNIREKYINHSFNDYMKSLNMNGYFKDFYNNQVFTPSPIHKIFKKSFTDKSCIVDSENIDINSLEIAEIIDNKTELCFVQKVINTVKQLKKEVSMFHDNNNYKHKLLLLLKKIELLYEEDFTLTDLTVRELLASNCHKEDLSIDPVIIVTIILCLSNAQSYPFNVYYKNTKTIVYDSKNRLYIRKTSEQENKTNHILLSTRASQKILYIDSGVAALFWKLVFTQSSLDKFELYSYNPCKFFEICPDHMFDLDAKLSAGVRENNLNITGYIDCSYDFAELMHEIFSQDNCYYKRSLITRAIIIMTPKGISSHIKGRVNEFLQKYMSPNVRHSLLNSEEEQLLEYYNDTLSKYLINSEVKNIFTKQILKPENAKLIGTILKPNLGKHRIYTKEETLSPEFIVDIYKRI